MTSISKGLGSLAIDSTNNALYFKGEEAFEPSVIRETVDRVVA